MKQGEKLLILVRRDNRSSEEIAKAMGVDRSYLPKLYKLEKLPPKPLRRAQEVFGVSLAYFLGEEEPKILVSEPSLPYQAHNEKEKLLAEIAALKEEIAQLKKALEQEKGINTALSEAILNMSRRH